MTAAEMLEFDRFMMLATLLRGAPKAVNCGGCGSFLNAVQDGQQIIVGSFDRLVDFRLGVERNRLLGFTRPQDRRVVLTCACGQTTNWFRARG